MNKLIAAGLLAALTLPAHAEVSPRITNPAIVAKPASPFAAGTTTGSIDADKRDDASSRDVGQPVNDQSQEFGAHHR